MTGRDILTAIAWAIASVWGVVILALAVAGWRDWMHTRWLRKRR